MANKISFEMVLNESAKLPLVRIDRDDFLRKELSKVCSDSYTVNKAIDTNPANAGIDLYKLDQIATQCIRNETLKVTALSTASGIPGGLAMFGTVPADLVQYYGHVLRILQKLVYLYGWQELIDDDGLDDGTQNLLTLFIGIMFGVSGATTAIAKIAQSAASKTAKSIFAKALTKGTLYPIIKKVATTLGVKMTKEVFAKGVSKFVPILGGVVSGGLTLATFTPMANKLKSYLRTLPLADAKAYQNGTVVFR